MAEPIEMPFGLWTWVGPIKNHVKDGGLDPPAKVQFGGGRGGPLLSIGTVCRELCKNGWTSRDAIWDANSSWSKEACIRWDTHWHHVANIAEPSTCGGDAAFRQVTLTTFYLCVSCILMYGWCLCSHGSSQELGGLLTGMQLPSLPTGVGECVCTVILVTGKMTNAMSLW